MDYYLSLCLGINLSLQFFNPSILQSSFPPLPEILASRRQLMVLQRRQQLLQLQEQPFARFVAVGKHVEWGGQAGGERREHLHVLWLQQRGRRYGYRLTTCREHRPAVAAPLGDVERFLWPKHLQHRQVVDAASGAVGEAEAGKGRS